MFFVCSAPGSPSLLPLVRILLFPPKVGGLSFRAKLPIPSFRPTDRFAGGPFPLLRRAIRPSARLCRRRGHFEERVRVFWPLSEVLDDIQERSHPKTLFEMRYTLEILCKRALFPV